MSRAGLPMYDLPEVRAATDALWAGLAAALGRRGVADVPARLTRPDNLDALMRAPDLLFAQTCGYPLTHGLKGCLRVVATPLYDAPENEGANYRSLILVRADDPAAAPADLRGRVAAVNGTESQSGYSALRAVFAPHARAGRFFGRVVTSGAHANSLAMVADGVADVCATDSNLHALLTRHRPAALAGLRVLARAPLAPGLPYVTRATADDDILARLRDGLFEALAAPDLAEARAALLIAGAEILPDSAYQRILAIEREALDLGYDRVA